MKTENNEHINLKVAGQDGSVVQFKIKRHTPLSKLMKAYCERQVNKKKNPHLVISISVILFLRSKLESSVRVEVLVGFTGRVTRPSHNPLHTGACAVAQILHLLYLAQRAGDGISRIQKGLWPELPVIQLDRKVFMAM